MSAAIGVQKRRVAEYPNIRTEDGRADELLFWVAVIAGCVAWLVVAIGGDRVGLS
jgi:hypothetical protein